MPPELERRLRALEVDWPETPDLAAAVARRIAADPAARTRFRRLGVAGTPLSRRDLGRRTWPRVQWATVALVVVAVLAVAMAVPPARSAILEFLGLDGVRIERREPVATPAPALPPGLGAGLGLGERVTEDEAQRRAGFRPEPSGALPQPDAVYFAGAPAGGMVTYVYAPGHGIRRSPQTGAGLLVSEFVATATPFIEKAAGPGTHIVPLRIDGDRGYWLAGRPHGFAYQARDGSVDFEEQRLAGPTLLLERDGLLLRIEGRVTRARAVAIARSIGASR